MGTSGAFGGSGGKDAKDLRDSIADWLDDLPAESGGGEAEQGEPGDSDRDGNPDQSRPRTTSAPDITSAIRILVRGESGGGVGGSGAGGAGGGGSSSGGGSPGGGARRSVGGISRTTGRAGALARAYVSGDRVPLEQVGLNYDELLALGDPVQVGLKIVEAAFENDADSTIEDSEARGIAAEIVEWILEAPAGQTPTPDEIVRKSIEAIITEVTLTEVGDRIRAERSFEKRRAAEQEIRDTAENYAKQAQLTITGASDQEIAAAVEGGIRELGTIFGVGA